MDNRSRQPRKVRSQSEKPRQRSSSDGPLYKVPPARVAHSKKLRNRHVHGLGPSAPGDISFEDLNAMRGHVDDLSLVGTEYRRKFDQLFRTHEELLRKERGKSDAIVEQLTVAKDQIRALEANCANGAREKAQLVDQIEALKMGSTQASPVLDDLNTHSAFLEAEVARLQEENLRLVDTLEKLESTLYANAHMHEQSTNEMHQAKAKLESYKHEFEAYKRDVQTDKENNARLWEEAEALWSAKEAQWAVLEQNNQQPLNEELHRLRESLQIMQHHSEEEKRYITTAWTTVTTSQSSNLLSWLQRYEEEARSVLAHSERFVRRCVQGWGEDSREWVRDTDSWASTTHDLMAIAREVNRAKQMPDDTVDIMQLLQWVERALAGMIMECETNTRSSLIEAQNLAWDSKVSSFHNELCWAGLTNTTQRHASSHYHEETWRMQPFHGHDHAKVLEEMRCTLSDSRNRVYRMGMQLIEECEDRERGMVGKLQNAARTTIECLQWAEKDHTNASHERESLERTKTEAVCALEMSELRHTEDLEDLARKHKALSEAQSSDFILQKAEIIRQMQEVVTQKEELERAMARLADQATFHSSTKVDMERLLRELAEENNESREECGRLRSQLHELGMTSEEQFRGLKESKDSAERETKKLRSTLASIEQDFKEYQGANGRAMNEYKKKIQERQRAQQVAEEALVATQVQCDELRQHIKTLEEQLNVHSNATNDYSKKLHDHEKAQRSAEEQALTMKAQCEQLRQYTKALEDQLEEHLSSSKKLAIVDKDQELEEYKAKIQHLEILLATQDEEGEGFLQQLLQEQEKVQGLTQERDLMAQECEGRELEIQKLAGLVDQLETSTKLDQEKIQMLMTENTMLSEKCSVTTAERDESSKEVGRLANLVSQREKELASWTEESTDLNEELRKMYSNTLTTSKEWQAKCGRLEEEKEEFLTKLSQVQEERQSLALELEMAKRECTAAKNYGEEEIKRIREDQRVYTTEISENMNRMKEEKEAKMLKLVAEKDEDFQRLAEKVKKLRTEHETEIAWLRDSKAQEIQRVIGEKDEDIERVTEKLRRLRVESESELTGYKEELRKVRAESGEEIRGLKQESKKLARELDQVSGQLEQVRGKVDQIKADKETESKTLRETIEKLGIGIDVLHKQKDQEMMAKVGMEVELEELRQKLEDKNEKEQEMAGITAVQGRKTLVDKGTMAGVSGFDAKAEWQSVLEKMKAAEMEKDAEIERLKSGGQSSDHLSTEMEYVRKQVSDIQESVASKDKKIQDLVEQLFEVAEREDVLRSKFGEVQDESLKKSESIDELRETIAKTKEQAKLRLDALGHELEQMQQERDALKREIEQMNQAGDAAKKRIGDMADDVQRLTREMKRIKDAAEEELGLVCDEKDKQVNDVVENLKRVREEKDRKIQMMDEERKQDEERLVEKLKRARMDHETEMAWLRDFKQQEMQQVVLEKDEEIGRMADKLKSMDEQNEFETARIKEELKKARSESAKEIQESHQELRALRGKKEAQASQLNTEIQRLRSELEQLRSQNSAREAKEAELNDTVRTLNASLGQAKEALDSHEDQSVQQQRGSWESMQQQAKDLQKANALKDEEIAALTAELRQMKQRLKERNESSEDETVRLKRDLTSAEEALESIKKEKESQLQVAQEDATRTRAENEAKIQRIIEQEREDVQRLSKKLQKARDDHEAEMAWYKNLREQEASQSAVEKDEDMQRMADRLKRLREEAEAESSRLSEVLREARANHEKEVSEVKQQLKRLREVHETELELQKSTDVTQGAADKDERIAALQRTCDQISQSEELVRAEMTKERIKWMRDHKILLEENNDLIIERDRANENLRKELFLRDRALEAMHKELMKKRVETELDVSSDTWLEGYYVEHNRYTHHGNTRIQQQAQAHLQADNLQLREALEIEVERRHLRDAENKKHMEMLLEEYESLEQVASGLKAQVQSRKHKSTPDHYGPGTGGYVDFVVDPKEGPDGVGWITLECHPTLLAAQRADSDLQPVGSDVDEAEYSTSNPIRRLYRQMMETSRANETIISLQRELDSMRARVEESEEYKLQLMAEADELHSRLESMSTIASPSYMRSKSKEVILMNSTQNIELEEANEALQSQVVDRTAECANLTKKLETAQSELQEVKDQLFDTQHRLQESEHIQSSVAANITNFNTEYQTLQKAYEELANYHAQFCEEAGRSQNGLFDGDERQVILQDLHDCRNRLQASENHVSAVIQENADLKWRLEEHNRRSQRIHSPDSRSSTNSRAADTEQLYQQRVSLKAQLESTKAEIQQHTEPIPNMDGRRSPWGNFASLDELSNAVKSLSEAEIHLARLRARDIDEQMMGTGDVGNALRAELMECHCQWVVAVEQYQHTHGIMATELHRITAERDALLKGSTLPHEHNILLDQIEAIKQASYDSANQALQGMEAKSRENIILSERIASSSLAWNASPTTEWRDSQKLRIICAEYTALEVDYTALKTEKENLESELQGAIQWVDGVATRISTVPQLQLRVEELESTSQASQTQCQQMVEQLDEARRFANEKDKAMVRLMREEEMLRCDLALLRVAMAGIEGGHLIMEDETQTRCLLMAEAFQSITQGLVGELSKEHEERREAERKAIDLVGSHNGTMERVGELCSEYELLKGRLLHMQVRYDEAEARCESQEQKCQSLQDELERSKSHGQEVSNRIQNLIEENKNLQDQHDQLQLVQSDHLKLVQELEESFQEASENKEVEISGLLDAIQHYRVLVSHRESEAEELKKEIEGKQSETSLLTEQVDEYRAMLANQTAQLDETTNRLMDGSQLFSQVEASNLDLKNQVDTGLARIAALEIEGYSTAERIQELEGMLVAQEKNASIMQQIQHLMLSTMNDRLAISQEEEEDAEKLRFHALELLLFQVEGLMSEMKVHPQKDQAHASLDGDIAFGKSLRSYIQLCKEFAETKRIEIEGLQSRENVLSAKNAQLSADKEELLQRIGDQEKQESSLLTEYVVENQERVHILMTEYENLEKVLVQLQESLDASRQDVRLRGEEKEVLSKELEVAIRKATDTQLQVEDLKGQHDTIKLQYDQLNDVLTEKCDKVSTLEQQLKELLEYSENVTSELNRNVELQHGLEKELKEALQCNSDVTSDIEKQIGQQEELESRMEELLAKYKAKASDLETTEGREQELKKEQEHAQSTLNANAEQIKMLAEENTLLREKIATLHAELDDKNLTSASLCEKVAHVEGLNGQVHEEVAQARAKVAALEERLKDSVATAEELEGVIKAKDEQATKELAGMSANVASMATQMQECQRALDAARDQTQRDQKHLTEARELNHQLEQQLSILSEEKSRALEVNHQLEHQLSIVLEEKGRYIADSRSAVQMEEARIREVHTSLQQKIASLQSEGQVLRLMAAASDARHQLLQDEAEAQSNLRSQVSKLLLATLQRRIDEEIAKAHKHEKTMEDKFGNHERELHRTAEELNDVRAQLLSRIDEIVLLKEENARHQREALQHLAGEKELATVWNKIEEIQCQLGAKDEEIQKLRAENASLSVENSKCGREVSILRSEFRQILAGYGSSVPSTEEAASTLEESSIPISAICQKILQELRHKLRSEEERHLELLEHARYLQDSLLSTMVHSCSTFEQNSRLRIQLERDEMMTQIMQEESSCLKGEMEDRTMELKVSFSEAALNKHTISRLEADQKEYEKRIQQLLAEADRLVLTLEAQKRLSSPRSPLLGPTEGKNSAQTSTIVASFSDDADDESSLNHRLPSRLPESFSSMDELIKIQINHQESVKDEESLAQKLNESCEESQRLTVENADLMKQLQQSAEKQDAMHQSLKRRTKKYERAMEAKRRLERQLADIVGAPLSPLSPRGPRKRFLSVDSESMGVMRIHCMHIEIQELEFRVRLLLDWGTLGVCTNAYNQAQLTAYFEHQLLQSEDTHIQMVQEKDERIGSLLSQQKRLHDELIALQDEMDEAQFRAKERKLEREFHFSQRLPCRSPSPTNLSPLMTHAKRLPSILVSSASDKPSDRPTSPFDEEYLSIDNDTFDTHTDCSSTVEHDIHDGGCRREKSSRKTSVLLDRIQSFISELEEKDVKVRLLQKEKHRMEAAMHAQNDELTHLRQAMRASQFEMEEMEATLKEMKHQLQHRDNRVKSLLEEQFRLEKELLAQSRESSDVISPFHKSTAKDATPLARRVHRHPHPTRTPDLASGSHLDSGIALSHISMSPDPTSSWLHTNNMEGVGGTDREGNSDLDAAVARLEDALAHDL